ncbi:carbohydrate ABC transporter permease [Microbacterium stercoris]|uniref:Sugar ABC transporter permease n=1 Tax=Microbacterium stercoris TaxID=2820289 RepID=A0A939QG30_9MICO|nr:sugar ABC transporter permease [Microbacterium stercoris]MBO3662088.1 sugar ABC transporter permease [Microbacterium stercoris]
MSTTQTATAAGRNTSAGDARNAPRPAARRRRIDWRKNGEIALLSGPAILLFLTFVIFPVFLAAFYGFFKWDGIGALEWNGLQNYVWILEDPEFRDAVGHNFGIVIASILLQGPLAILFALVMNQKIKGRSFIRIMIFVPYVISEVVVGLAWSMLMQDTGAINQLFGLDISWLSDPSIAFWSLMIIITWKYIGFAVILMLAGMQSIPEELYEAAAIDGASFWKMQWSITLPLLGPTIRIWAFLSIIGSLQLFDLVFIVWGRIAPSAGVHTMAFYMYTEGHLSGEYGFGSAVAVLLFLISLIVGLVYQRFVLRRDIDGALTDGPGKDAK